VLEGRNIRDSKEVELIVGIRGKLFVAVLALAIPVLIVVGFLSYAGSKTALEESTFDHMTSVRAGKADRLRAYFEDIRTRGKILAESELIRQAIQDFSSAARELDALPDTAVMQRETAEWYRTSGIGRHSPAVELQPPADTAGLALQYRYLVCKDREDTDFAGLAAWKAYDNAHRRHHRFLKDLDRQLGFSDILLIDRDGLIVYTIDRGPDLGRNVVHGSLATSNLATAFRASFSLDEKRPRTILVDYASYPPTGGRPAFFAAIPIRSGSKVFGVLVMRISVGKIDRILTSGRKWQLEGLGKTGESYLVGRDFLMRSDSRFYIEDPEGYLEFARRAGVREEVIEKIRTTGGTILAQEVRTPAVVDALAGKAGTALITDYRGVTVLSSFAPLADEDLDWVILSEMDASEALGPVRKLTRKLLKQLSVLLILFLGVSWYASHRFVAPIEALDAAASRIASGEKDVEVHIGSSDELGRLAETFNDMVSAINRHTAELARKAEELESINSVILRWDPEGRILFINDYGLEIFGFSRKELLGRKLAGTIVENGPEVEARLETMAMEIAENPGKYETDETENLRKSGERIWIAWRNKPILDEAGRLREILTIGIDITERRRIEQEIARQKQLLENTLESLTHPFYVIDVEDYSIKVANSAARRMGAPGAETCYALTHRRETPCDGEEHRCPLKEVLRTGRPAVMEHLHRDAAGGVRYVEVHGYPIFDDEGRIIQMIEYSLDITERKKMEIQLESARDAAEVANRAKSTFLANMSHELRTPMNAIIGYSEMLAEDAEDEGCGELVPDLEKINTAGKHLLALINDILDLSKIEAGRMDLYLETFDLEQMLDEAVVTLKPLAEKNGNELKTDFVSPGRVRLDLTKLRQAVFNLLSNAAKFTRDGRITLGARREARDDGEWIVISVEDTGIGIAPEKLEKVFEEFSQADDSTTRNYGGTGLGLAISRRFCRMMGGDIRVESEFGKGTTFSIELPARVDALQAARKAAGTEESASSTRVPKEMTGRPILVVDDDPNSRDMLSKTLSAEGFSVVTASDGEEALEKARQLRPALITLDVLMPGLDGWSVLEKLKSDPELDSIPVVMVSIAGNRDLGCMLGAVDCLTKPVDREKLRRLAHRHVPEKGPGFALVIDDDEGVRSLFTRTLQDDGWEVAQAGDGVAALRLVEQRRPDLVLLDLMMPVMDGFEFVLHFRTLEGCAEIPVIVVTAKDLEEDERRRLVDGVQRIIRKGALTRQELLQRVRELAGSAEGKDGTPDGGN